MGTLLLFVLLGLLCSAVQSAQPKGVFEVCWPSQSWPEQLLWRGQAGTVPDTSAALHADMSSMQAERHARGGY